MLHLVALTLLAFVALYPVVTSAVWVAGGGLFRLLDERNDAAMPPGGWPGISVLIPAYNEEETIANCARAALAVDYPELEVLVLDDGSSDATVARATEAGAGDPRLEVVRDPVNRGKADRLNLGFRRARHEYVVVTDADTHLQRLSLKLLMSRMMRSPRIGAVAGSPHVTNRRNVIATLQILEAASIIGLIRRTQALIGRVSIVAGVLGLFRRDAVLAVGGYDSKMATEDIDLTWRLLFAGWHTAFEPDALCGMEVPAKIRPLWAQRRRWACGQGEVLHTHGRAAMRWRHRGMWPLAFEAAGSLLWVIGLALALTLATIDLLTGDHLPFLGIGIAWGIAIAVVALLQLSFALAIDHAYDRRAALAFILGPLYPLGYWTISAAAALRTEVPAAIKGPREERVVWDIEREHGNSQAGE